MRLTNSLMITALLLTPATLYAQASGDIRVEVEHAGNTDFSLTPVWFGFHNSSFDAFDTGDVASPGLELIAELGQVGTFNSEFAAAPGTPGDIQGVVLAGAPMTSNPPPIQPGETGVAFVTPINPANYQYFSFLSMVIPTNDTFIGNEDNLAYQIFNGSGELIDASGLPTDVREIQIFADSIYDAGTEVDGGPGAAFTQGVDGTLGTAQNGTITQGPDLSGFLGVTDATGLVINDPLGSGELLATIRVSLVPEPTTGLLAVVAGLAGLMRRR